MSFFAVEHHDAIAVVTFTRPPRNLMNLVAIGELEAVLRDLAASTTANVVVLTGGVDGSFIAHADLEDVADGGWATSAAGDPQSWVRVCALLESMPQPTVAAVNGQAWGGGCEICLACTVRVAADAAHFGLPEVSLGIIPAFGGTQRLPRLIGPGKAAHLVLWAEIIGADEAERLGLVEAVFPDKDFLDHVIEWVAPMAAKPREALFAAKRAITAGVRLPLEDGLRLETELLGGILGAPGASVASAPVADVGATTTAEPRADLG